MAGGFTFLNINEKMLIIEIGITVIEKLASSTTYAQHKTKSSKVNALQNGKSSRDFLDFWKLSGFYNHLISQTISVLKIV